MSKYFKDSLKVLMNLARPVQIDAVAVALVVTVLQVRLRQAVHGVERAAVLAVVAAAGLAR